MWFLGPFLALTLAGLVILLAIAIIGRKNRPVRPLDRRPKIQWKSFFLMGFTGLSFTVLLSYFTGQVGDLSRIREIGTEAIATVSDSTERTKVRPSGKTKQDYTSYLMVNDTRFYVKKKLRVGEQREVIYVTEPRKEIAFGTKDDSIATLMWKHSRIFLFGGILLFGVLGSFVMAFAWMGLLGEFLGFGDMKTDD